MKKFFLIATAILLSKSCILAQHYKTAAGVRLGTEIGLTIQQVVTDKVTLEGIFSTRSNINTYNFAVLGERHFNILSRRMNVYLGAGAHVGILKEAMVGYQNTFGVSGIGGLELTIRRLNFSLDYKPAMNLSKGVNQDRFAGQFALSARYVLIEREKFSERMKKKFKRKT